MVRLLTTRGVFVFLALEALLAQCKAEGEPIEIGTRRELFVDRTLVDRMEGNVRLVLAEPRDEGEVLRFDAPWEGMFSGYVTILADGQLLRAYYRGRPDGTVDGGAGEVTCYAESRDGIHWAKPELGLFEVGGTHANNIVLADAAPITHNFSPFLDTRPDCMPEERYKAIGGTAASGLVAYVSADGRQWRRLQEEPVFRDDGWVFDSQNVAFWSESEACYVLYYRRSVERVRAIARSTSHDFRAWSEPVQMAYGDSGDKRVPDFHLYTNQTHPYFRAPHIYIATAARFMPGRQVVTEEQARAIGVHPRYFGDTSDAVLLTSRGGDRYDHEFPEGFLRPGIGLRNWVSRTNYPALNLVQTGPHEMSLYVNQDYGQSTAHLRRYSLRLDGFASVRASAAGGALTTKPLVFEGNRLEINFATSAAGGVRVELQEADGTPIPGFTLDDAVETIGNEIERVVRWNGGEEVELLSGRPVRLHFVLRDADLYSFRFRLD